MTDEEEDLTPAERRQAERTDHVRDWFEHYRGVLNGTEDPIPLPKNGLAVLPPLRPQPIDEEDPAI